MLSHSQSMKTRSVFWLIAVKRETTHPTTYQISFMDQVQILLINCNVNIFITLISYLQITNTSGGSMYSLGYF